MNEALICKCGSARFHLVKGGLIECSKCQKHIEARWAETNGFDWLNREEIMKKDDGKERVESRMNPINHQTNLANKQCQQWDWENMLDSLRTLSGLIERQIREVESLIANPPG